MPPLSKPHVNELQLEKSCLDLWQEFLAGWFDGGMHTVGANAAIAFPSVELRFQQAAHSKPLNGVGISLVWTAPSKTEKRWETVDNTTQQVATAKGTWTFFIRGSGGTSDKGNAAEQVRTASDLLFAVLNNADAAKPLTQKGIRRLRPTTPQAVQSDDFQLRMLSVGFQLRYPVLSQKVDRRSQ